MLWRMRLIGSLSPLPAPRAADINSDFFVKEIRDYYVPNSKNIILRWDYNYVASFGDSMWPDFILR